MSIYLRLFGRPQVECDGVVSVLPAERRFQVLALLALRRDWISRAETAALFWPELPAQRAYGNLRKTLHLARSLPWTLALELQGSLLRLVVATDVQDFESAAAAGDLAQAARLWRRPLLEGFERDGPAPWCQALESERVRLARRWQALTRTRLAQLENTPAERAAFARELLADDPLDEDAVAALLAAQRDLSQFEQQHETYRDFAGRLLDELGVEPSARVRALLRAPPPATFVAAPANTEGFVGRAGELQQIGALLARAECRLLTIVGPGGVGKSRTLKQAVRQLAPQFPDGVVWIALDDLTDTTQVAARVAAELHVAAEASDDPLQHICTELKTRHLLIALDNAEHLTRLAPLVERLLSETAAIRICATSRARLGAAGEWLQPLRGLALPPAQATATDLLASEAAQLFVSAARAVKPDFDAAAEAAAIGTLVRTIDGLPLAILLAANWVRLLPVAQIARDVERSLDVLESADAGEERPEHHSVRATFEQSWRLLAPREQQALAALSVFVGSFTREAARAVAEAALPLLGALSDKSLVQVDAGTRISLHPLIRHFAAEKLAGAAADVAQRRHADWFHRLLARGDRSSQRADAQALAELEPDLENCRQAWHWAVTHAAPALLASSARMFALLFETRGRVPEALLLLRAAQPVATAADAPAGAALLAAAIAHLHYRLHRIDDAVESARQGLKLARAAGSRSTLIRCLNTLGLCEVQSGRMVEAKRIFEQSLRQARAAKDTASEAAARNNLALAEKALGNYAQALRLLHERLAQERADGDWLSTGYSLVNLAAMHVQLGAAGLPGADWSAAREYLAQGFEVCERYGLALFQPYLAINRGLIAYHTGARDEAKRSALQALEHARTANTPAVAVPALLLLARLAAREGESALARARVHEALAVANSVRSVRLQLEGVLCCAEVFAAAGATPVAVALARYFLARAELEPIERAMAHAALPALDEAPVEAAELGPTAPLGTVLAYIEGRL